MPKILLVKTSSMGDVIHELPAVTDILATFPDAIVDWVVEENFRQLPALHPGVRRVLPIAIRRWRRTLARRATWREMAAFRRSLQRERYDLVLDSQGLIKSAAITLFANGPRCGYDGKSAREPLAALAYHRSIAIPCPLHAVERNRLLAGRALGYVPNSPPDYGIRPPQSVLSWLPDSPYAVLLHATSRADKEWPESYWLALAGQLNQQGVACVLPWGGEYERERSERLARQIRHAIVPPRLGLAEAVALLAGAWAAVGVDTGLSHLAAALGVPVVALYCATDPGLTGVFCDGPAVNLGGRRQMPTPDQVVSALAALDKA